jgi:hypothetical protein
MVQMDLTQFLAFIPQLEVVVVDLVATTQMLLE